MGPLEIYILLTLLHQPATLVTVLLVEALGLLIERATFLIPAKLVSQEGGKSPDSLAARISGRRRLRHRCAASPQGNGLVLLGLAALAAHRMFYERAGAAAARLTLNVIEVPSAQRGQSP